MGDEVMYSQILPMIYEDCSSLTVECDERLIKTFACTFPDIAFFQGLLALMIKREPETLTFRLQWLRPWSFIPKNFAAIWL